MENALVPMSDIERMGSVIAKSGLFGMKTADQAVALMLVAQAEHKHPATAAMEYHIIQGRPSLRADAMLARFQAAGGKVEYGRMDDACCEATFSHAQGGSVKISWDMVRAAQAGLNQGKDNWKKYPRQMLRARCISEGVRTVFPGVVNGFYTPEEAQDFDEPAKTKPPVDTAAIITDTPTPAPAASAPAPQAAPIPQQTTVSGSNRPVISELQAKRFYAIAKGAKKSDDDIKLFLLFYGITSPKLIPKDIYQEVCENVVKDYPPKGDIGQGGREPGQDEESLPF